MEFSRKHLAIAVVVSLIIGWVWYSQSDQKAVNAQGAVATKAEKNTEMYGTSSTTYAEMQTPVTDAMGNSTTTTAKPAASTTTTAVRTTAKCANPTYKTSDPDGMFNNGGYFVHNNMWNGDEGGPQTLYACAYNNWYVVSTQPNTTSVKTYPNVHKDFNEPAINSFKSIKSTFAAQSPHVGIYNVAYDIWINGIADDNSSELMIWTENFNQRPSGNVVSTVTLGGRTYDVWKSGTYIAFVPKQVVTSGSIDLLEIMKWTMSKGYMPNNSSLGQIDYGVEICSTNNKPATFTFTDFSVTTT